jgi:hypothetical protein
MSSAERRPSGNRGASGDCLPIGADPTRAHGHRALDELARHGCPLRVWVDHAGAPTNFGPNIMKGPWRGGTEPIPICRPAPPERAIDLELRGTLCN